MPPQVASGSADQKTTISAVLKRVLQQVVLLGQAQAVALTPHVGRAPVPAFPAVGVVLAVGEAHQVHEAEVGAVAVADVAPHVVRTGGAEDGARAAFPLDPLDLGRHDVEGLVPGDGLVARGAPVPGVTAAGSRGAEGAGGVEVDALERGEDPLGRVDQGAVGDSVGRVGGLAGRAEGAASRRRWTTKGRRCRRTRWASSGRSGRPGHPRTAGRRWCRW